MAAQKPNIKPVKKAKPGDKRIGNKFAKGSKTNGAKTKLTEELIRNLSEVIEENVLYATDEELVFLVNEKLPENNRFTIDAFSKWKRGESQSDNVLYKDFLRLIKKALFKEKKNLLELLKKDPQSWQRYAWIIERKFDEWNIKIKQELTGKDGTPLSPATIIFKDFKNGQP